MNAPLKFRGSSWPKGTMGKDMRRGSTMTALIPEDGRPHIRLKIENDGPGNDHEFHLDVHALAALLGVLADAVSTAERD